MKIRNREKWKKSCFLILTVLLVALLSACGGRLPEGQQGSIYGTWYSSEAGEIRVYEFSEDGILKKYYEDHPIDFTEEKYEYDKNSGKLRLESTEFLAYSIELTSDCLVMDRSDQGDTLGLYRDKLLAVESDTDYLTDNHFAERIKDENGWCIRDGILYAYMGEESEIVIPEGVTEIYVNAFSPDEKRASSVRKVTIPGSVRKIDKEAFSGSLAKTIIMKEGVEEIGDRAFSGTQLEKIRFPRSARKLGKDLLETENGLDGIKIYVKKESAASEYFKEFKPKGKVKLVKE